MTARTFSSVGLLGLFLLTVGQSLNAFPPLRNDPRLSAHQAERELIGTWVFVAGFDTRNREYRHDPPSEGELTVEFGSDRTGVDRTDVESTGGLDFTWEVVEEDQELWLRMFIPSWEESIGFKLVFHDDTLILKWVDYVPHGDEPSVDVVVYRRR